MTSHTGAPGADRLSCGDTPMEEWEEVLPSPPMLSESLSSRTNLTSGVLSLSSKVKQRIITEPTLLEPRVFLLFLQGRTGFIFGKLTVYCTACGYFCIHTCVLDILLARACPASACVVLCRTVCFFAFIYLIVRSFV